ncbi:MAG: hypothetical protein AB7O64_06895 [Methylibium sp.]
MPKKAVGGPRDSVFSVRLPARLRYGVELISRLNREPKTDVIVRAIDQAMTAEHGGLFVDLPGEDLPVNLLPKLWDERESVRLVKLALVYPTLLTAVEKTLWARIREEPRYWDSKAKKDKQSIDDLRADRLEADWSELRDGAS